jgi:hypothetical protein
MPSVHRRERGIFAPSSMNPMNQVNIESFALPNPTSIESPPASKQRLFDINHARQQIDNSM